jgi:hypothetical protein
VEPDRAERSARAAGYEDERPSVEVVVNPHGRARPAGVASERHADGRRDDALRHPNFEPCHALSASAAT